MPTRQTIVKRSLLGVVSLLGFACLLMVVISKSQADRNAPRFVPGSPPDAITNLGTMTDYDWGDDIPFQGNRAWLWTASSLTGYHCYWVDMDDRRILGELFKASAVFCNKDRTKLFCVGHNSLLPSLKQLLAKWFERATGGKFKARQNRNETFWILDLRNNRAKLIGSFSQFPGTGSRWHPAPGFRFGYNVPSTSNGGEAFYLCDLEQEEMKLVRFRGSIQGWWDEHHLLVKDPDRNFILYDVTTRQTKTLFTANQLQQFLEQSKLPDNLNNLKAAPEWTGDRYAFYFSARTNWINGPAFVLKPKPGNPPALEIFQRDFQFEWLGHLNSNGTLYLFPGESGRPGAGGDGSVHLRNVQTGETRTLVESNHSNQYTLPRFYKDRVIYVRSHQLWSVDVSGSNNFKLFRLR